MLTTKTHMFKILLILGTNGTKQTNICHGYKMKLCRTNPTPSSSALALQSVEYFKYKSDVRVLCLYCSIQNLANTKKTNKKTEYNQLVNRDECRCLKWGPALTLQRFREHGGWDERGVEGYCNAVWYFSNRIHLIFAMFLEDI